VADAVNRSTFASWFGRKDSTISNAIANEASILLRILDTIFETRAINADREIAASVAESDRVFTDGIEREIMRRSSMVNSTSRW
jgi:hypothetical protein